MVRVYAAILQAAQDLHGSPEVRDPYWTLLGYFNSLRVLGSANLQVEGDVRDTAQVETTLRRHAVTAVMHFAALLSVGESVREPARYYDTNVRGSLSVLDAMLAAGAMLTETKVMGARELWGGRPARKMRDLDDAAVAVVVTSGGTGISARDAAYETISGMLEKRLDQLERLISSQAMVETPEFTKAATYAPPVFRLIRGDGKVRGQRYSPYWLDHEVRALMISLHRQLTLSDAVAAIAEEVGLERAPSRTALQRIWKQLDKARSAA